MRISPKLTILGLGVVVVLLLIMYVGVRILQNESAEPSVTVPVVEDTSNAPVHTVIGQSVEGRSIDAYTYGTGATRVLFVGGMHGGYEWNSVLLAYRFMDYLDTYPEQVPEHVSITVIPAVNPDGVYAVTGTDGRFTAADVAVVADGVGRFNAHDVDLNRNFACKWQPESSWRGTTVSAGTSAFSEPETQALRDFVTATNPTAVVFWHSQSNAVYASECEAGVLPVTRTIMHTYATATAYPAVESFDAYPITGDAEGWLASIGIPAITVELQTHETIEWERNRAGILALLSYLEKQ